MKGSAENNCVGGRASIPTDPAHSADSGRREPSGTVNEYSSPPSSTTEIVEASEVFASLYASVASTVHTSVGAKANSTSAPVIVAVGRLTNPSWNTPG